MFEKKLIAAIACAALAAAIAMAGCSSSASGSAASSSTSAANSASASSQAPQATLWAPQEIETVLGESMSQVSTYAYAEGNPVSLDVTVEGLAGAAAQTTFEYDGQGLPVAGTSAGSSVEYDATMNEKGQLVTLVATTALGDDMSYINTTEYAYDAEGNIVKKEDSGEFSGMDDASKMSQTVSYEDGLPVLVIYEQSGGEGQYSYQMAVSYAKVDDTTLEAEVSMTSGEEAIGTSKVTITLDANGNIEKVANADGATIVAATYTQLKDPSAYAKAVFGSRLDTWVSLAAGLSS